MDVEVSPENTVSGTAIIAVDESLLELSGQSADQLFKDMDLSDLPAGATTEKYQEDGFIGQQITFDDVPLAEFTGNNTLSGTGTGSGDQLDIVRQGDEFHRHRGVRHERARIHRHRGSRSNSWRTSSSGSRSRSPER